MPLVAVKEASLQLIGVVVPVVVNVIAWMHPMAISPTDPVRRNDSILELIGPFRTRISICCRLPMCHIDAVVIVNG